MAEACGHGPCLCAVADDERFCSDHCRRMSAAGDGSSGCRCGHAACETDDVVEIPDEVG